MQCIICGSQIDVDAAECSRCHEAIVFGIDAFDRGYKKHPPGLWLPYANIPKQAERQVNPKSPEISDGSDAGLGRVEPHDFPAPLAPTYAFAESLVEQHDFIRKTRLHTDAGRYVACVVWRGSDSFWTDIVGVADSKKEAEAILSKQYPIGTLVQPDFEIHHYWVVGPDTFPKPAASLVHAKQAELFWNANDFDSAIIAASEAIRLDPSISIAYAIRADSNRCKGEIDRAIADASEVIRRRHHLLFAYSIRAAAYRSNNEVSLAQADEREMIPLTPKLPFLMPPGSLQCKSLINNPITALNDAIQGDPTNASAYANRADIYRIACKFDAAIADASEAIRLDPINAVAFGIRAESYRCRSEFELAIADATEAIRLNHPDAAFVYRTRGECFLRTKRHDLAILDASEAIRLEPTHAFAYGTRGMALCEKSEFTKAVTDLTEAHRLDPDDGLTRINLEEVKRRWRRGF